MNDCESYCSHGGKCSLMPLHDGKHKAMVGFAIVCEWTDAESITRAKADRLLLAKPGGAEVVAASRIREALGRLFRGWPR